MNRQPPEPGTPDDDERRRIIEAAWRVLGRTGFQGLKVAAVVKEVPISTRAFYRWFEDKDHLVIELVCAELRGTGRRIDRLVDAIEDPVEAVRTWVDAFVSIATEPRYAARAQLFYSMRAATRRFPQELRAAQDQLIAGLSRAIERGARAGVFNSVAAIIDARSVCHLCSGTLVDELNTEDATFADGAAAETIGFVLRALGPR